MISEIVRYYETVRHLKARQILAQAEKRLSPAENLPKWKAIMPPEGQRRAGIFIEELDCNAVYQKRFDAASIVSGTIELLHQKVDFDGSCWNYSEKTPLWNFNLHYFEYAIALAFAYRNTKDKQYVDCFEALYVKWMQTPVAASWHPYTISLRVRNLLIAQEMFGDALSSEFSDRLAGSIYQQYAYLQEKIEIHLLGNHYFENLVTIVICSIVFKDKTARDRWFPILLKEIHEQVLPDGVHFERSLMYHKLILEDLIRIAAVSGKDAKSNDQAIISVIQQMLNVVVSLEKGCGRTPLFNDCGDNVARPTASLVAACGTLFGMRAEDDKIDFPIAGYYKMYAPYFAVMMDAGPVGPDYMPGHAQCDALSFELFYHGRPIFVNSGTGQYQGALRKWYRSTAAHNTIVINEHEQSDCWGEHRVGRRLRRVSAQRWGNTLSGECVNQYGEMHRRKLTLSERCLAVEDRVLPESAEVKCYLHVSPGMIVQKNNNELTVRCGSEKICEIVPENSEVLLSETPYAAEFEEQKTATQICFIRRSTTEMIRFKIVF